MNPFSTVMNVFYQECKSDIYQECLNHIHQEGLDELSSIRSKSFQDIKDENLIKLSYLSYRLENPQTFDLADVEDINQFRSLIMFTISLKNQTLSSQRLKNCIKLFGKDILGSAENAGVSQHDWTIRGFLPTASKCNNLECAKLLMECPVKKRFGEHADDHKCVQDKLSVLYTFMEKADSFSPNLIISAYNHDEESNFTIFPKEILMYILGIANTLPSWSRPESQRFETKETSSWLDRSGPAFKIQRLR